ncbi:hypothetical protein N8G13_00915 [Mycoplasma zalophi]|uniref:hypothetical protein n=1 Tax=Mycoplasma zalophi TaxID=191287 RepID=UPI0021CA2001|nr:hypothetical protein [Mycoplasma zalophi]MCU4117025.1 hypothetical protein [Mycoplasma zalophi]
MSNSKAIKESKIRIIPFLISYAIILICLILIPFLINGVNFLVPWNNSGWSSGKFSTYIVIKIVAIITMILIGIYVAIRKLYQWYFIVFMALAATLQFTPLIARLSLNSTWNPILLTIFIFLFELVILISVVGTFIYSNERIIKWAPSFNPSEIQVRQSTRNEDGTSSQTYNNNYKG